ncbi:MAG: hypothetical protein AB2L07_17595 [Thermoanaerobaculaceae bacterium]
MAAGGRASRVGMRSRSMSSRACFHSTSVMTPWPRSSARIRCPRATARSLPAGRYGFIAAGAWGIAAR